MVCLERSTMDFSALTLGIIFIIVSIFLLLFKKSEKYVERKIGAIMLFIFGIVFIILAFITNMKLGYLIFGLTFIIIGIWILYLKKKNPEDKPDRVITALICFGFGIIWILRVIP